MTVLLLWVGTNSQPPPGHTIVDSQQALLMLGTKHSKFHLPTTISRVKQQFRGRNLASRAQHTSVKLLQDLGRARKLITISKLSSYSSYSDQDRTEKLIV